MAQWQTTSLRAQSNLCSMLANHVVHWHTVQATGAAAAIPQKAATGTKAGGHSPTMVAHSPAISEVLMAMSCLGMDQGGLELKLTLLVCLILEL